MCQVVGEESLVARDPQRWREASPRGAWGHPGGQQVEGDLWSVFQITPSLLKPSPIVWTSASVPLVLGGLPAESQLQVGDPCTGQVELSDLPLSRVWFYDS